MITFNSTKTNLAEDELVLNSPHIRENSKEWKKQHVVSTENSENIWGSLALSARGKLG